MLGSLWRRRVKRISSQPRPNNPGYFRPHGSLQCHNLNVMATFPEVHAHLQPPFSASYLLLPPVRSGIRLVSLESTWAFLTPKSLSFVQVPASFSQNSLLLHSREGQGRGCNVPFRSEKSLPPSRQSAWRNRLPR